ncbi:hypothetical protein B0A48_08289 [Cryoendolithus antarcticus]|uniref:F-box domain-containing protein n=1 Tax=Cryoendolithus antarcticus TaxID=1507870 RepID=A0A1V8T516_9PEZI|nr:hypothetical protein B0A48_08289 [Cryoendolithus antarcticus]
MTSSEQRSQSFSPSTPAEDRDIAERSKRPESFHSVGLGYNSRDADAPPTEPPSAAHVVFATVELLEKILLSDIDMAICTRSKETWEGAEGGCRRESVTEDSPNPTSSACQNVFGIIDLTEKILAAALGMQQLFALKRVNKHFHNCITGHLLSRVMFPVRDRPGFGPFWDGPYDFADIKINPFPTRHTWPLLSIRY